MGLRCSGSCLARWKIFRSAVALSCLRWSCLSDDMLSMASSSVLYLSLANDLRYVSFIGPGSWTVVDLVGPSLAVSPAVAPGAGCGACCVSPHGGRCHWSSPLPFSFWTETDSVLLSVCQTAPPPLWAQTSVTAARHRARGFPPGMSCVRYGTRLGDLKNKQPTHTE